MILPELNNLPRHSFRDADRLQGLYFLYLGDDLVYIGKSNNIRGRLIQHIDAGDKDFDSWSYFEMDVPSCIQAERELIQRFRPKYNLVHKFDDLRSPEWMAGKFGISAERIIELCRVHGVPRIGSRISYSAVKDLI